MTDTIESVEAKRGITRTEHALKSVMNGGIEDVRPRLIAALEQLEYHVVTDEPLQARRPSRGAARYYMSANILEYPTKLTISLREIGPGSTLATLDYVSEHPGGLSFNGDLDTQKREAEAVIAIAGSDRAQAACSSCGTAQTAEGRFCRVCGAPIVSREPSELEMLRVTAGARSGHHLIASGTLLVTMALIASFAMLLAGGLPGIGVGLVVFVAAAGLLLVFLGIAALSKALASSTKGYVSMSGAETLQIPASRPDVAPPSVTEGTTKLLSTPTAAGEIDPIPSRPRINSRVDK